MLLDRVELAPGEIAIVNITFLFDELLGEDFEIGKTFQFFEGLTAVGEGEILAIEQVDDTINQT